MSAHPPRPRPQATPDIQQVLDALVEHLDYVLDSFHAFGLSTKWEAGDEDAPAERDKREAHRHLGPAGPWSRELFDWAHAAAVLHTSMASQLLSGLQTLVADREVMFAPAPIVRSLLENCGFVCWLIYPGEPYTGRRVKAEGGRLLEGWGPRRRGARAYLTRVEDLTHRKAVAKALNHPNLPQLGRQLRTIRREWLHELFYDSEIDKTDGGQIVLRGETYPALRELASWVERLEGANWNSSAVYAILSRGTHPSFTHLSEFVTRTADGEPGRWQLDDAKYIYRLIRAAILTFTSAWRLVAAYLGQPQDKPRALAQAFDQDSRFDGL